jgi:SAM-dependent methyltransferase
LFTGILPSGGTFADIGCGQGLTLAALIEGRHLPDAPTFTRLIGIETRRRVAAIARAALGGDAEIVHAYAPEGLPAEISAAALFDVLHLMPLADQEALLVAIGARIVPGGVLLVREADRDNPHGFMRVRIGNQIKAIAVGRWKQRFYFRGAVEWTALFNRHGWNVETLPISSAGGFANVLFKLTRV